MENILVHDYAGHPFLFELSLELSKSFKVSHAYHADDGGPKFEIPNSNSNKNLSILPLTSGIGYSKTNLVKRFIADLIIGFKLAKFIYINKFTTVFSANTPSWTQLIIILACKYSGARFNYWLQDFYSYAVTAIISRKNPVLGKLLGKYTKGLDRLTFKLSDHIIVITEDFRTTLCSWHINPKKITAIPNWGIRRLFDGLPSHKTSLTDEGKIKIIYTGTCAKKHRPDILLALATYFPKVNFFIYTWGEGTKFFQNASLPNLKLYDLIPTNQLGATLKSATFLISTLEKEAASYCVPSKILNYICAEVPIIFIAPENNLASKVLLENNLGYLINTYDFNEIFKAFKSIISDNDNYALKRKRLAQYNANYSCINSISKKFENLLSSTTTKI